MYRHIALEYIRVRRLWFLLQSVDFMDFSFCTIRSEDLEDIL